VTNSNDTNTVTKWTISNTSATSGTLSASAVNSANKTTWMVLGDSCIYASRWLCAMWGGNVYNTTTGLYDNSYMKSDMVQLAHHGNIGCEIAIYKTIQATVVWFPHNAGNYNNYTQDSDSIWTDTVDRFACNSSGNGLKTVKYVIVSGIANTNFTTYTDTVTINFNSDGLYLPSSNPGRGIKYNKSTGQVTRTTLGYNSTSNRVYNSPIIKK
jgi:hypothetical protein